jgi:hypothetical protein
MSRIMAINRSHTGHALGSLSVLLSIFIWAELLGLTPRIEKYLTDFVFAAIFFGTILLAILAGWLSSRRWFLVILMPIVAWAYVMSRGH